MLFRSPNLPGDDELGTPDVSAEDVPSAGTTLRTVAAAGGDARYRVLIETLDADHAHVWAIPIDDVETTIQKANEIDDRPVVIDFRTDWHEKVYPMVPAGSSNDDVILGPLFDREG